MVGWSRCWRVCGRIARWRFEVVWLATSFGRGGEIVRFGMGGDEEYAAFLFLASFLVPALVFGGLRTFCNWELRLRVRSLAQFCVFLRGMYRWGKTVRGGEICYRLMVRSVVTLKSTSR